MKDTVAATESKSQPPPSEPGLGSRLEGWDLLFWSIFAALIGLTLMPVWVTDVLPVLDAAPHLHLITIIHDYARSPLYQHYYAEVDVIVPYLSFYKLVDWLGYIAGVEWANRVVLSLCLAMLPVSALHLLRALGHNRWLVLAIFPWALSADFFLGFFNYLMSIPIFLWILAAHVHFLRKPNWKSGALLAGLLVCMAITHYLLWAVSLILLPAMAGLMGWRVNWRKALKWPLREALVCLPSIGTLMPWFLSYFVLAEQPRTTDQVVMRGASWLARIQQLYSGNQLTPLANLEQIFGRMFNQFMVGSGEVRGPIEFFARRPGELFSALWLAGMALWLLAVVRTSKPRTGPREAIHGTVYAAWTLLLVALAYFHLPQHLSRPIYLFGVNFRLVEVLAILLVVALPVRPLSPERSVRFRVAVGTALMLVVAVWMPLQTAGAFMLARTEMGSIREAFGAIPPGQSVLTLRWRRMSAYLREPVFTSIGEYYAVFQGGYVPYSFADSSSKPAIARIDRAMPKPVWFDHGTYSMKRHGRFYDYIVIYRPLGEGTGSWERSVESWQLVYHRDRWKVYKNPAPDEWPEPTAEEFARRERLDMATATALAGIGMAPGTTTEMNVDALLKLMMPNEP